MDKYYKNIKELIESNLVYERKQEISVNYNRLQTYYNIGKIIVEAQGGDGRAKYGNGLIKQYSIKLTEEYGKQYSERILRNMRQFFLIFRDENIWRTLSAKLSWSHFEKLLTLKNENKRNYYINAVIEHNFSVRELRKYIKSDAYERLVSKDNIKLKYINNSKEDNLDILDMIKEQFQYQLINQ